MTLGQGGWARWARQSGWWLFLLAGCAASKGAADPAVQSGRTPAVALREVSEHYRVSCPDNLQVRIGTDPPVDVRVRVDGRIYLIALSPVRVEGLTCAEIERRLAGAAHVPEAAVHVQVVEFRSQQIYIFGEVHGLQRAVPYQGEETVLQLLRRAGGLSEGAAPDDVTVVRSHVADGRQPELFPIHLDANAKNARAELKLEPFDQVYIGETRRSCFRKCLPPWLRPLYESLFGMKETKP